jgi:hypothetical protein
MLTGDAEGQNVDAVELGTEFGFGKDAVGRKIFSDEEATRKMRRRLLALVLHLWRGY